MFDRSECNSFRTERHISVKPNHQQEQIKKRQKGFRRKVFSLSLIANGKPCGSFFTL